MPLRRLFRSSGKSLLTTNDEPTEPGESSNHQEPKPLPPFQTLPESPPFQIETSTPPENQLMNGPLWGIVQKHASLHKIDPLIVASIILQESAGNTWAVRFEPGWKYSKDVGFWAKKVGSSLKTESNLQSTSFGLMQVMGAVAREHGFDGWLTELCNPEMGISVGVKHLAGYLKRWGFIWDAVSAYNQGSPRKDSDGIYWNADYVVSVKDKYHCFKTEQDVRLRNKIVTTKGD